MVEDLKRLHAEGMTNKQIAIEMACFGHCYDGGRSAVSGKINRLHLPPITKVPKLTAKAKTAKPVKKPGKISSLPQTPRNPNRYDIARGAAIAAAEPGVPEQLKGEEPDGTGIQLCDLTDETCRWPRGDPKTPNFEFCGTKPFPDFPYCARHCALAYPPAQERNRST